MKSFQREGCLAVWFLWALPGGSKAWREWFLRKMDEAFTRTVSTIQHLFDCWNPHAGKPGFSDVNMQCHMLCVQSEGNGPFPFILMQGGMDQNSGGKDQVAI